MMELLHERLREWAGTALSRHDYASHIALADMNLNSGEQMAAESKLFYVFANEIENAYAPKAVDANGKPWEINDPCVAYSNDAVVVGYGEPGVLIIRYCNTSNYSTVYADNVVRPEERTPIEKLRDEIASYAHSHVPDSVLDGWVKDLDAYIDQQGKDE